MPALSYWNIAMARDENNRNIGMCAGKFGLKVEPAHFRQAHIEHQATLRVGRFPLQEFPRRGETSHRSPTDPITDLKPSRTSTSSSTTKTTGSMLIACCVMTVGRSYL